MKIKLLVLAVGSVALLGLSACSTIQSWFPDKEKDYQYTTEIPELHVPEDLEQNAVIDLARADTADSTASSASEEKSVPIKEREERGDDESGVVVPPRQAFLTDPAPFAPVAAAAAAEPNPNPDAGPQVSPETDDGPPIDLKTVTVELPKFTSNDNHFMRIALPLRKTWNVLGKALTRNSMEIIHRDQEDGLFTVQYDPEEKPLQDDTIMDEVNFFFHGFNHNEQELSLKLIENNGHTDIVVVDINQQPVPDSTGFKLLESLQKTIKADLAN